jgi:Flp pilus assembly pilin Flp
MLRFLRDESGGTVEWLLCIIGGALLAAVIMKYLKPGVQGAAQNMGNALQGK